MFSRLYVIGTLAGGRSRGGGLEGLGEPAGAAHVAAPLEVE